MAMCRRFVLIYRRSECIFLRPPHLWIQCVVMVLVRVRAWEAWLIPPRSRGPPFLSTSLSALKWYGELNLTFQDFLFRYFDVLCKDQLVVTEKDFDFSISCCLFFDMMKPSRSSIYKKSNEFIGLNSSSNSWLFSRMNYNYLLLQSITSKFSST